MIKKLKYSIPKAYSRIMDVTGTTTQNALANFLGIAQTAVARVLKNNKDIPSNWLIAILQEKKVNPFWIMYGDEYQKYLVLV